MEYKIGVGSGDILEQSISEQQQAIAQAQAQQQKIIAQQEADLQVFRAQQQALLEAQQQAQKQAQQQAQLKAQQEAQVLAQKQQTLAVQAKNEAHQQSTMDFVASSLSIGLAIFLIYYFLIKKSSVHDIKNGVVKSILNIYFLIGYAVAGISALSVCAYYFVGPGAFWNGSVGIVESIVGLPIGLFTSALRIVLWPLGLVQMVTGKYSISEYLFYTWFSK